MDALPLDRRDWHGDWNYTLHPREHGDREYGTRLRGHGQPASNPGPSDQPSRGLAWLCRPALTGMPAAEWDALITTLMTRHDHQRKASLDKRRGHRPRQAVPGAGRRPALTLADRLLAAILHYRLSLPQVAIATVVSVRSETVSKRLRGIRQPLDQAGTTIQPGPQRLATLQDLHDLARSTNIDYLGQDQVSALFSGKPPRFVRCKEREFAFTPSAWEAFVPCGRGAGVTRPHRRPAKLGQPELTMAIVPRRSPPNCRPVVVQRREVMTNVRFLIW
jgi:hypothetical protein